MTTVTEFLVKYYVIGLFNTGQSNFGPTEYVPKFFSWFPSTLTFYKTTKKIAHAWNYLVRFFAAYMLSSLRLFLFQIWRSLRLVLL